MRARTITVIGSITLSLRLLREVGYAYTRLSDSADISLIPGIVVSQVLTRFSSVDPSGPRHMLESLQQIITKLDPQDVESLEAIQLAQALVARIALRSQVHTSILPYLCVWVLSHFNF